jgi:two-component system, chemotaxis family, CheB/CheR fusion protein
MKTSKQNGPESQSQALNTLGGTAPSPQENFKEPVHTEGPSPASRLAAQNKALLTAKPGSRLDEFFSFVSDTTGVDLRNYELASRQRRIKRRMNLNKFAAMQDYLRYAERTPSELEELLKDFHIHADRFFHDTSAFEAIQKHVFPALLRERKISGAPIRIWVPICLTGAEVYSIAIALLESMQKQGDFSMNSAAIQNVQIFASGASEAALDRARNGLYSEPCVANVSRERLMQFFVPIHGGYQIHKSIRDICLFAKQDLTRDSAFAHLDLILFRNLPNHVAVGWQESVIRKMHYALRPNAYLMLGAAGSLGAFSGQFEVVDDHVKLYRKRETEVRRIGSPSVLPKALHRASEPRTAPSAAALLEIEKEIERLLLRKPLPACLLVNGQMEMVPLDAGKGASQKAASERRDLPPLKARRDGFLAHLRFALDQAKKDGKTARKEGVVINLQRGTRKLDLEVIPVSGDGSREHLYVIMFREPVQGFASTLEGKKRGQKSRATEVFAFRENVRLASENKQLKAQLESLAQDHEAFVEELQSANEELSSANEELQTANEEMETAKEELQSTNEELTMVNSELQSRNMELSIANNDLLLLGNVPIPWVLVGGDMRVRRFTPPAQELMNLTSDCIGKHLGETGTNLDEKELEQLVREAISASTQHEREIRDENGRWHVLRVRPYKTWDSKLDGAVISFQDIDALKRNLDQEKVYAKALFENARESILLLDEKLKFSGANPAFCRTFGVQAEALEGLSLHQFSSHLDISNLQSLLSQVLVSGSRIDEFEMSLDLPRAGKRSMILNARRIEPHPGSPLILLAIEDITEKRKYLEDVKRHAALLELASDAVFVRDLEGRIQFWNRGAEELYGWKKEEVLGKLKQELLLTKFPKPLREIEAELGRRGRWEGELEHIVRDGTKRIVRSHWALQRGAGSSVVLEINSDVTEKRQVEESLRKLSSHLIRVQDQERRRIARELHDSTGQKLMALKMTLNSLGKRNPKIQGEASVSECVSLVDEATREIRTLAQLLHPPLLDEAGLAVATRWLVDGFSKRSGIVVDLLLPPDLGRLPENTEIALFRIIQEALNNIHQHSGADGARIEVTRTSEFVTLQVRDNGKGMREILDKGSTSASPMFGIGIQGMKERLSELNGTLEIVSGKNGTTITANVPCRPEQP